MPPLSPSLEALAVLRAWLSELEDRVAAESTAQGQHSADEREDRELAAAWAARHRARVRHPRPRHGTPSAAATRKHKAG